MKAVRVHEFGPPEVMRMEELVRPVAGPGEVLVEVAAAGVGPWDAWVREGKSVLPQPLPLTPGSDVSGTVVAVGAGVTHLHCGDAVYGQTNSRFVGGYAELAVCDAAMIALKPRSIDHIAAASIPVVAVTAWQALFEHARLEAGDVVLIVGATGNVGGYAIQFAQQAGIRVVREATDVEQVDAVVDLVGGETQTRSFSAVRRGGMLVSAVSAPDAELARTLGVEAKFFLVHVDTARLQQIAGRIDAGALTTNVGSVLPLTEAVAAHEMLVGIRSRPRGKIVLAVK